LEQVLTYKKAIRLSTAIFKERGLSFSSTVQKQIGYLILYATEGDLSKHLLHQLKERLKVSPCKFVPGSVSDEEMLLKLEKYSDHLQKENPSGGEIDLGWLMIETKDKEIWQFFSQPLTEDNQLA